jgi:hypothetical protein
MLAALLACAGSTPSTNGETVPGCDEVLTPIGDPAALDDVLGWVPQDRVDEVSGEATATAARGDDALVHVSWEVTVDPATLTRAATAWCSDELWASGTFTVSTDDGLVRGSGPVDLRWDPEVAFASATLPADVVPADYPGALDPTAWEVLEVDWDATLADDGERATLAQRATDAGCEDQHHGNTGVLCGTKTNAVLTWR